MYKLDGIKQAPPALFPPAYGAQGSTYLEQLQVKGQDALLPYCQFYQLLPVAHSCTWKSRDRLPASQTRTIPFPERRHITRAPRACVPSPIIMEYFSK